jgi:hypothetical protein
MGLKNTGIFDILTGNLFFFEINLTVKRVWFFIAERWGRERS